jgi:universal stress protein A
MNWEPKGRVMENSSSEDVMKIGKILVPTDFSNQSRAALQQAQSFARRFEARIDLLHVWEPPEQARPDVWLHVDREARKQLTRAACDKQRQDMLAFLRDVPDDLAARVYPRLASGVVVDEILSAATREGVGLIVMGTHGRRGLAHLFLGSVTEKVLRLAPCPVLVVRQARDQQRDGREAA